MVDRNWPINLVNFEKKKKTNNDEKKKNLWLRGIYVRLLVVYQGIILPQNQIKNAVKIIHYLHCTNGWFK